MIASLLRPIAVLTCSLPAAAGEAPPLLSKQAISPLATGTGENAGRVVDADGEPIRCSSPTRRSTASTGIATRAMSTASA